MQGKLAIFGVSIWKENGSLISLFDSSSMWKANKPIVCPTIGLLNFSSSQYYARSGMALLTEWRMLPSFQLSVSYLDSVHMCAVVFVELVSLWLVDSNVNTLRRFQMSTKDGAVRAWHETAANNKMAAWPNSIEHLTELRRRGVHCLVFVELSLV